MRTITRTIIPLLILNFISCGPVIPENRSRDFLITNSSIGRVRLGASNDEIIRTYADHNVRHVDLRIEGSATPALEIFKGEELLLTVELLNGIVYRIRTTNPKFHTSTGIHVGENFSAGKQLCGTPSYIGDGEAGFVALFDSPCNLTMVLDVQPYPMVEYLKNDSKIVELMIVQLPKNKLNQ